MPTSRSPWQVWLTRLRSIWVDLRTSFWFIPVLGSAVGLLAASAMISTDKAIEVADWLPDSVPHVTTTTARAMLSTFVGALVSAITIIFSLTMVALTTVASQFGPRVITGFLESQRSQQSIGVVFGAFVYCVSVLWVLPPNDVPAPTGSVLGAILAMAISMGVLLSFIQYVSQSVRVSTLIRRMADNMDRALDHATGDADEGAPRPETSGSRLRSRQTGYVRLINREALVELAERHDLQVTVQVPVGSFVMQGAPLISVHPAPAVHPHLSDDLLGAVAIGPSRSYDQDPLYQADQILDLALRALSPGINDPRTAIACLDRIGLAIVRFMHAGGRPGVWRDASGEPRVWVPTLNLGTFVEHMLPPIVAAGKDQILVAMHIQHILEQVAERARHQTQRDCLVGHAQRALAEAERGITDEGALEGLREQHRRTLDALQRTP